MTKSLATIFVLTASVVFAQTEPGLHAVYRDGKTTVHRVVPTPNFTLAADESVHSQIAPKFEATYTGVLKVSRGGDYTITADAQISIDGKKVEGTSKLTPGDHPISINYARKAGPARLQLRWSADFFTEEPVPPKALAHKKDPATDAWSQIERGRLLFEDLSCGACHGSDAMGLSARKGPDLSEVASRVTDQWLQTWLRNPHSYRKTAAMPKALTADADILDVTAFLSELGTADETVERKDQTRIDAGKEIFDRVGCAKCHTDKTNSLDGVGSKYRTSAALASFLIDPLHVDPSGRMPQLFDPKSQAIEAEMVAEFLFHTRKARDEWADFEGGNALRGRTLVQLRGCVACHSVKHKDATLVNELKSPQFAAQSFDSAKGCLADKVGGASPDYQLAKEDRASLQAFLNSVAKHPVVAAAPVETFYRRVEQFNCTACHALNDKNLGPAKLIDDDGKVVTIERPPTLTAAGDKLQVDWIRSVLVDKKRTRPWMGMRMPHFGNEAQSLPELFPAASGSPMKDSAPQPKFEIAKAGHEMIGMRRGQVACINCHNYRGINQQKEGVVPAPDMAEIGKTLRADWFRRWLHNPSRMQPGTSMPQFFVELKGDEREAKIDELWSALVHQSRLPLPEGLLGQRTEGTKIVVGNDPVVFRVATKLTPKIQIDRAINVGLPGKKNFLFDARTARLRGVWTGEFINAGPAWNGRGGNPVSVVPDKIFVAPDDFPLRIGDASAKPEVRFLGYSLVQKYPVFRYLVDGVEVHERIELTGTELSRQFNVAVSTKPVLFVDNSNAYQSSAGEFKDGVLTIPAGENLEFQVKRKLELGRAEIKPLKWIVAGENNAAPKSKNGRNTSVIFENKSSKKVKIVWVGYDGSLKTYGQLDPGGTHRQNTYANNTWLITDQKDRPLGHFIVDQSDVSQAVIPK